MLCQKVIQSYTNNHATFTFKQLYQLYNNCVTELLFYARHVPGIDEVKDRKLKAEENSLLDMQEDIIAGVSSRTMQ